MPVPKENRSFSKAERFNLNNGKSDPGPGPGQYKATEEIGYNPSGQPKKGYTIRLKTSFGSPLESGNTEVRIFMFLSVAKLFDNYFLDAWPWCIRTENCCWIETALRIKINSPSYYGWLHFLSRGDGGEHTWAGLIFCRGRGQSALKSTCL
jgi:hypothetical protein